MIIELEPKLVEKLENLAHEQGKTINEIAVDILQQHFDEEAQRLKFRKQVRDVMEKHAELLDRLAKS